MSDLDVDRIVKEIERRGLTAYKIAQSTSLSEVGINKILSGKSKKPQQTTINVLNEYLFGKSSPTNEDENVAVNKNYVDVGGMTIGMEHLALLVAQNENALMKEKVFSNIIEIRVAKRIAELSNDPEKFKEFLEG